MIPFFNAMRYHSHVYLRKDLGPSSIIKQREFYVFTCFKKAHQSTLAIDINPTAITLMEMSITQQRYCIERYGRYTLSNKTIDRSLSQNMDDVIEGIRCLVSEQNPSSKEAVLAIADSLTISKVIQIHAGCHLADIEEWVLMEVEKYIPHPIQDMYLDFYVVGPSVTHIGFLDVCVVACRKEPVQSLVDAVVHAGLSPLVVDVESYAIERLLRYIFKPLSVLMHNKTIVLFKISTTHIHGFVFDGNRIIDSYEEIISGIDLSQPVSTALDFNDDLNMLIVMQIKQLWQYLSLTHHMIEQSFIAGEIAYLPSLQVHLIAILNIPVTIINPLEHMIYANHVNRQQIEQDSALILTVCGLALRQKLGHHDRY